MYALPPVANGLDPGVASPWLPPIRFHLKSYLELCRSVDQALEALEQRYPARRPTITLETRHKLLPRRPK